MPCRFLISLRTGELSASFNDKSFKPESEYGAKGHASTAPAELI
jgi:hypothetical protein